MIAPPLPSNEAPVAIVTPPVLPAALPPETTDTKPLTPLVPALAEPRESEPLEVALPAPEMMLVEPPVETELAPAEAVIAPPAADEDEPVITRTAPPAPPVAAPEPTVTAPEAPKEEVPDPTVTAPLAPPTPALALPMVSDPLEVA